MNYQVERWPAFKVIGISNRIKTDMSFELVPQIWDNAWKDGTMQKFMKFFPDYRPSGFLGIDAGGGWGSSDEMHYILAVTNHVDMPDCTYVPAPEGMTEFSYPAASSSSASRPVNGKCEFIITSLYCSIDMHASPAHFKALEYIILTPS